MGQLVVDLRDTSLPAATRPLNVRVGMGQALVIVPRDVCVAATADVGAGHVDVLGREGDGVNVDFEDGRARARRRQARGARRRASGLGEFAVRHNRDFERRVRRRDRSTTATSISRPATGPAWAAMHRPDLPSLVSGLALIALGTVLLFDRLEMIEMGFGAFGPIAVRGAGRDAADPRAEPPGVSAAIMGRRWPPARPA